MKLIVFGVFALVLVVLCEQAVVILKFVVLCLVVAVCFEEMFSFSAAIASLRRLGLSYAMCRLMLFERLRCPKGEGSCALVFAIVRPRCAQWMERPLSSDIARHELSAIELHTSLPVVC